jgi:hypothetical protein
MLISDGMEFTGLSESRYSIIGLSFYDVRCMDDEQMKKYELIKIDREKYRFLCDL